MIIKENDIIRTEIWSFFMVTAGLRESHTLTPQSQSCIQEWTILHFFPWTTQLIREQGLIFIAFITFLSGARENLQLVSNSVAVGSKILCGRFRKKSNFIISIQKVLYHVFCSINVNVKPVVNALLKKPFPEIGKKQL